MSPICASGIQAGVDRRDGVGARVRRDGRGVSAVTTSNSFPDARQPPAARRDARAATAGIAMLLGPVSAIDTVGGYTVYKGFVFLTTIGAIWGLLVATRLLRGEEDTGPLAARAGRQHPRGARHGRDAGRARMARSASCSSARR